MLSKLAPALVGALLTVGAASSAGRTNRERLVSISGPDLRTASH